MNDNDTAQLDGPMKKMREIVKKNPVELLAICSICHGEGFYYYYDTPTPCDHCKGSGKVQLTTRKG
jgi:DnaJ-class molecular chaperone